MNVQKACKEMLITEPYYGFVLMSLNKIITKDEQRCPTLQVELQGIGYNLVVNEIYWNKLTDDEQLGVIKHELMHLCFFHLEHYSSYAFPDTANVAMDMEINQYIKVLPKGCVDIDLYKLKVPSLATLPYKAGSKVYYEALLKAQKDDQNNLKIHSDGSSSGKNGEVLSQAPGHDSWKDYKKMTPAEKKIIDNQFNGIINNAAEQTIKSRGTIPGEMQKYIDSLKKIEEAVFNWKAYFRRLIGNAYNVFTKKSQRKFSKRFDGSAGLKIRPKHNILVGVDTSCSVSDSELVEFFNEIHHIYKTGASIDIIHCDTKMKGPFKYKGKWDGKVHGRGGTFFNPVIDYYNKNRSQYTTLIYFTDGGAPLDFKVMKSMIWIISSLGEHKKYPGQTIYIPKPNK